MLYLDNAATSFPKPEVVYRELQDYLRRDGASPGRGGHQWAVRVEKTLDDTRSLLARFFGMDDYRRVIFTLNGTDSLNMAIKGVVRPGDHVVTSLLEHNSVSRPLKQLESDGSITLTQLPFSQEGVRRSGRFPQGLDLADAAGGSAACLQRPGNPATHCRSWQDLPPARGAVSGGRGPDRRNRSHRHASHADRPAGFSGPQGLVRSARHGCSAGGPAGSASPLAGRRYRFRFGRPRAATPASLPSGGRHTQHPGGGGLESRPWLRDRRGPGQDSRSRTAFADSIDRIPQGQPQDPPLRLPGPEPPGGFADAQPGGLHRLGGGE